MRVLNPDHVAAIIHIVNRSPFVEQLSMKLKEIGIGYCVLEVEVEKRHLNPFGSIHGGVYASIIDTAAYWAAYSEIDEEAGMVTLDLKVNYVAAIKSGKMLVKSKSIKVGRSIALVEVTVTDLEGKVLAFGTSTLMLTPGRQTISQALDLVGGEPIPAKFLN